ncbi:MAG TPA: TetR/AcrR family transcriptional regulator [Conexibacter sp.]|nr:TetR/AcrR family transcriptional regulator [Conexibacter sp.]
MGTQGSTDAGHDGAALPRVFAPATQRERLLDGIAQTVAQRGYAATPVAEVLKAAGVSRRTFYEQFADKEDCFLAAYDAIVALCTERLVTAYHAGGDWDEGIERAYDALLRTLAAEPAFAHLGVVDVFAAGPAGIARRETTLRRFARFIDYTRERAEMHVTPPRLVGQAIVGGIYELLYSRIVRGETARLPDLTDELLHYTFMLLGVPRHVG